MNPIEKILEKQKVLIIDGAFGTELERKGYDINDSLWSAKFLMEKPEAIAEVHLDYLKAGSDCITTASYQASFEGFMKRGMSEEEAKELIQSSITIAQNVRDTFWENEQNHLKREKPLVAASVGPYGAYLADGSEFRGNYGLSVEALMDFHRKRLTTLIEAKPDLLACETIPCLIEAKALCKLLEEHPTMSAWVSFSAKDGTHINSGESIRECTAFFETQKQIVAIGINCTAPQYIESLIDEIKAVSSKPIIVYPNGGSTYNALTKTWDGISQSSSYGKMAYTWYQKGARIIGGCCQTTPEDIAQIAQWVRA
ncbi:homocysteine S-methyltransferase [Sulfurospirillum multivorans DSM 12446]|uniref:S-methylmethionine:homocysteine methyltransferase n=3 Tax=Sulfurospirillum multivorans TaxID=66821 RepID=A0AA86DXW5_SULMK|nr:homocysteine S-methyltransferase [Sulfurospirillum multivorans DSM 12446]QEH05978.1 homocysteine S-methyltransferase [Sulfurospirillum multivorans]